MIAIIDAGMGHAYRVGKVIERFGVESRVSSDPQTILHSDGVILSGAGTFGDMMLQLGRHGLDEVLWDVARRGIPLLGAGLGMQVLFTESEEHGLHRGLNILSGSVRRLPSALNKPHIGWNELVFGEPHPFFAGVSEGYVYFLHSYYVETDNAGDLLATTDYGGPIAAIVGRNRVFGMQFHPEKSGPLGMALLKKFANVCEKGKA